MRLGERRIHLMRWYNLREGLTAADDTPARPLLRGADRVRPARRATCSTAPRFGQAIATYYAMMGWDGDGRPRAATLYDHGLEWVLAAG